MTTAFGCHTRQGTFRGWQAAFLENEFVRLTAVPDIGGRVMAYDLGVYPFIFVDPDLAGKLFSAEENQGDGSLAAWKNYGGDKTWPAPQGWDDDTQWHGPPDPVLDTGRYTLDLLGGDGERAVIRMISPPDTRTGVQITRQFTIFSGSSRVRGDLSFTNISDRPVRWSIWDVLQLRAEKQMANGAWVYDPACMVTTPLNPNSRFARGYNVMFGAEDNPQWQVDAGAGLFKAKYLWQIGKVGIDSPAGWIAFSQGTEKVAFTERFTFDANATYPDEGVTVECWTVGGGQVANLNYDDSGINLMETELMGPLRTIKPGATTTYKMEWGSCSCLGPIVDVQEGGCAAERLQTAVFDQILHVKGQFGVFDAGAIILRWREEANQIDQLQLGQVNPLTAVALDQSIPYPQNATHIDLYVKAAADGNERLLGTAVFK